MAPPTRVCITGSNAGVGYEAARQLALQKDMQSVVLACRNSAKAEEAKASLEKSTGKKCFEILILDLSSLDSIQKAVDTLQEPFDCLILNAGGFVSNRTQLTENGTMRIFDLNVLGGVHFTDLLLQQNKLSGHVLYVSSEASRGIKGLNSQHVFTQDGSAEEMKGLCNGECFGNNKLAPKELDVYGRVKLVGNFWAGSMARKHPSIRFIAVSPGNTAGTNVVNNMKLPSPIIWLANKAALPLMVVCGRFHPLHVGAQRYLDVIYDEEKYQSGRFYASATSWPTGRMADQYDHAPGFLYSESYQDNANQAIHSFLGAQQQ